MARFRPRNTFRLVSHLNEGHRRALPHWKRQEQGLSRDLSERWNTLHRHCADQSSQLRLRRLVHRLTHYDCGVRESALAELELATQLIRAGGKIGFLPESQAKTADLECHMGRERFFVEVTAMVGSADWKRLPVRMFDEDVGWNDAGALLIHRILARIRQKAKQLADYSDPVVLSISIPRADLRGESARSREAIMLDLKTLCGSVTMLLSRILHLSAVMITMWDVDPSPSKSGTRLVNVEAVLRSQRLRGYPRVRLLIENPASHAMLTESLRDLLMQIL